MSTGADTRRCQSCGAEWPAEVDECPACGREAEGHRPHHPSFIPGGTLPWNLPLAMKLFAVLLVVWFLTIIAFLVHRWY